MGSTMENYDPIGIIPSQCFFMPKKCPKMPKNDLFAHASQYSYAVQQLYSCTACCLLLHGAMHGAWAMAMGDSSSRRKVALSDGNARYSDGKARYSDGNARQMAPYPPTCRRRRVRWASTASKTALLRYQRYFRARHARHR
eukprot:COSAG01_NODE_1985_length_8724_cov_304.696928_4_plen_141_part_00